MTSSSDLLSFGIFALFAAGFCFYFYLLLRRVTRKSRVSNVITPEMRAMLKTEVFLTPEERKAMNKNLVVASVMLGGILLGLFTITAVDYWRFALTGEEVTASITNKSSHRSSGRSHRTVYTYTLQATVNGVVVKDSYGAGSSSGYKVGDTVRAYATNGASPELAIASIEDQDPFFGIIYFVGLGAFLIFAFRQRGRIRAGKMRLENLPEKFRKDRLLVMQSASSTVAVSASSSFVPVTPQSTTSSGLPMYTIGPGNEGNDGSNYKV